MRLHPNTHCQICGRPVHIIAGLIARHGHKQPYVGGQTSPCFGSHHKPYEVACDALPEAIGAYEETIKTASPGEAKMLGGELTLMRKRLAGWRKR